MFEDYCQIWDLYSKITFLISSIVKYVPFTYKLFITIYNFTFSSNIFIRPIKLSISLSLYMELQLLIRFTPMLILYSALLFLTDVP